MRKNLTVSLVVVPAIALLTACNLEQTVTTPPPQPTATTSTATTPEPSSSPVEVKCKSALGRIYSDVQLYLDAECTKPFAVIMGKAKDLNGEDGVLLRFTSGEQEVKTRDAVRDQAYVKADDPAISAQVWRQY